MINGTKMNVGQLLLRQGVLDEDQLAHAMAEHKRTGLMLSKILVRLGMVSGYANEHFGCADAVFHQDAYW